MRLSGSTSRTNSATDDRSSRGPAGLNDRARVEDVVRVEELLDLLGQLGDRARVTFRAVLDVARNWRLATRAALANYILVPRPYLAFWLLFSGPEPSGGSFSGLRAPRNRRSLCLTSGLPFYHSAPMEAHAFGFRLRANAPEDEERFLISSRLDSGNREDSGAMVMAGAAR
jgi:hypothetical protein